MTVTGEAGESVKIGADDTIFIPTKRHQTVNEGTETLTFLFAYVHRLKSIDEKLWPMPKPKNSEVSPL